MESPRTLSATPHLRGKFRSHLSIPTQISTAFRVAFLTLVMAINPSDLEKPEKNLAISNSLPGTDQEIAKLQAIKSQRLLERESFLISHPEIPLITSERELQAIRASEPLVFLYVFPTCSSLKEPAQKLLRIANIFQGKAKFVIIEKESFPEFEKYFPRDFSLGTFQNGKFIDLGEYMFIGKDPEEFVHSFLEKCQPQIEIGSYETFLQESGVEESEFVPNKLQYPREITTPEEVTVRIRVTANGRNLQFDELDERSGEGMDVLSSSSSRATKAAQKMISDWRISECMQEGESKKVIFRVQMKFSPADQKVEASIIFDENKEKNLSIAPLNPPEFSLPF